MSQFASQRQKEIFEAVVRGYIRTGEPVGSKTLADSYGLTLSPASIRKVLGELESLGLVSQAHASAGRAPTEAGLKLYVDSVLAKDGLVPRTREAIDKALTAQEGEDANLFSLLTKLLSELTSHMGLVMAPSGEKLWLKRIWFVKLAASKILAVLITENGIIQNRLIYSPADYNQDELNEVNACLEELPSPYTLEQIKMRLMRAMSAEKSSFDEIHQRVLALADKAQKAIEAEAPEGEIYMDDEGRGRLVDNPDFNDVEAMRGLFKAFENKRRLIELLNEVTDGGRVQVVFDPSGTDGCLALVASPYNAGVHGPGALGVLGPRRLNYAEIVPVVDYAAKVVSGLFAK
ncbi:MAG: heat-inducible transcriptional repressor HrcA [Deltaproteobacteria bacterium]|nr:heat-inducible transcriptional repressor HrcA [Deltaproteobacteria bacterium]